MLYIRALPEDIQRWAMSDWTWSDVLAQYHALETGIGLSADTAYAHGTTGPMATSPPVLKDKLGHLFLQTSKKLGISQSDDFNAPGGREGAGIYQFNIRDGVRDSAAVTLLASSLLTMPVALRTQTMVEEMKLSVDEGDPTSWRVSELRGVDGSGHKWSLPISRGKKVVAAAGAINTPALLMRSRIGNANILNESDGLLPPLVPLPSVGQGLQDHPAVGLVFTVSFACARCSRTAGVIQHTIIVFSLSFCHPGDTPFKRRHGSKLQVLFELDHRPRTGQEALVRVRRCKSSAWSVPG